MAQSSNRCYCSVPLCSNNKQHFPYLSFHDFPLDPESRAQWLKAIKRDEGPMFRVHRGSSYVCSLHFGPEDSYITASGRVRLKKGAVPSRFHWNKEPGECGFTSRSAVQDDSDELPVLEECTEEKPLAQGALQDHDYTCHSYPGILDDALGQIKELETEIQHLTHEKQQPLVYKFCITDEDFYYYTRFPSKVVFTQFWEYISPSDSELAYCSKAQWTTYDTSCPQQQLAPIDEFFMFLCRVGAGLDEKTLSAIFEVNLSTVTCVILKWTSYLYRVLGSLPTWMSKLRVQATMPEELKTCCPELRVALEFTKLSCETTASHSKYKKYTTFKGLIGIAPCGLITFISKLYTGSISDQEIIKRSKLLQLLEPGDGVMADDGDLFLNEKMVEDVGATLIIPPPNKSQLSSENTQKNQMVGCLRFLVERVKHRVKEYHIWDNPVPLHMTGSVSQLWVVCCLMSNFRVLLDLRDTTFV